MNPTAIGRRGHRRRPFLRIPHPSGFRRFNPGLPTMSGPGVGGRRSTRAPRRSASSSGDQRIAFAGGMACPRPGRRAGMAKPRRSGWAHHRRIGDAVSSSAASQRAGTVNEGRTSCTSFSLGNRSGTRFLMSAGRGMSRRRPAVGYGDYERSCRLVEGMAGKRLTYRRTDGAELRWRANQMRQRPILGEHFRRGNAPIVPSSAKDGSSNSLSGSAKAARSTINSRAVYPRMAHGMLA